MPRAISVPDLSGFRRPQPQASATDRPDIRSRVSAAEGASVAEVFLYDEIGFWGVMAADIVPVISTLDVDRIVLRVNSPGGDVFDGLAIYNALVNHPAPVTVKVEGLAASAASFIAMAGDEIVMEPQAQVMIHDAWGMCMGNAGDMEAMRDVLDRVSGSIAEVYAERAGGPVADWRAAMLKETWYSADEAVTAGLATSVRGRKTDDKTEKDKAAARASWDLKVFQYAGRENAPAPATITPEPDVPTLDFAAMAAALKEAVR